jgi:hypothetical protein
MTRARNLWTEQSREDPGGQDFEIDRVFAPFEQTADLVDASRFSGLHRCRVAGLSHAYRIG